MNRGEHGPAYAGVSILAIWAIALVIPDFFRPPAGGAPGPAWIIASLWFLLNFIAWMVPGWRERIVERRGPLLGFGYAFAAALVSAAADAFQVGAGKGAILFAVRLALLALPFILPHAMALGRYPHPLDLAVLAFAVMLPRLPVFDGLWIGLEGAGFAGFFGPSPGGIGPGHLAGMALVTTYFYGVRAWTGAPLDWRLRPGDLRAAVENALLGALGAWIGFGLLRLTAPAGASAPLALNPAGGLLSAGILVGLTLAPLFEELVARGIVQAALAHWLPKGGRSPLRRQASLAAAVAGGVLAHAALGFYGLPVSAGAGLSLGIGIGFVRKKRFLPAALGHAAAWLIALLLSRFI